MKDPFMRLVRCPRCRIRFETADAFAVCVGCGTSAVDENAPEVFDEDTREEVPTQRQHVILPPKE
jgi:hypothetical protein